MRTQFEREAQIERSEINPLTLSLPQVTGLSLRERLKISFSRGAYLTP